MKFTKQQKDLFRKNLKALKNPLLKDELAKIKEVRLYKSIFGSDSLDINFLDLRDNKKLFNNTLAEIQAKINLYNDKYKHYKCFLFYGFANGILYKALLQNKNLLHIAVFEHELELIYLCFHYIDFSDELSSNRLLIIHSKKNIYKTLQFLYEAQGVFFRYSRVYFLDLACDYYDKFSQDIIELNKKIISAIKKTTFLYGNDPLDSLQGVSQLTYNLKDMISNPCFKDVLEQRRNLGKTAIIVATGPSLHKQLPLLKEYAKNSTIFCADSAYPILMQNDIVPDYVCMVERTDFTAEFFKHDFGSKDDDTVFVLAALVHPNAISYLKNRNKQIVLIPKVSQFALYLNLSAYGLLNLAPSVSHFSFLMAHVLGYKNVIIIGQDLAYADDGSSHTKNYQHGEKFEDDMYTKFAVTAYGGEGEVQTHMFWQYFKEVLEQSFMHFNHSINIYNATEGGARIEHCIEKPFSECKQMLDENLAKPFARIINQTSKAKQDERMLKSYYKVLLSMAHCSYEEEILYKNVEPMLKKIKTYEKDIQASRAEISEDLAKLNKLEKELLITNQYASTQEIMQPLIVQFNLNFTRMAVLTTNSKEEEDEKNFVMLKEMILFFDYMRGIFKAQREALDENVKPLKQELIARGYEVRMHRIKDRIEKIKNGGGLLVMLIASHKSKENIYNVSTSTGGGVLKSLDTHTITIKGENVL